MAVNAGKILGDGLMNKKEISTIRLQSGETFYTQSVAVQLAEVSIDFLRECEAEGLIQCREIEGMLGYSAGDIRRLARIRIWPIRGFDKILIIYATERTGIDVLRVVHGARDLDVLELDPP